MTILLLQDDIERCTSDFGTIDYKNEVILSKERKYDVAVQHTTDFCLLCDRKDNFGIEIKQLICIGFT